jgi:hypothetical protein
MLVNVRTELEWFFIITKIRMNYPYETVYMGNKELVYPEIHLISNFTFDTYFFNTDIAFGFYTESEFLYSGIKSEFRIKEEEDNYEVDFFFNYYSLYSF